MQIVISGLDGKSLLEAFVSHLQGRIHDGKVVFFKEPCAAPKLGEYWPGQGGIYAGDIRGRDGRPNARLIVGPEIDGELKWKKAMDAAAKIEVEGHSDFSLPYREEQALMFANVPELFKKEWYWSQEQCAGRAVCAWAQGFRYGGQDWGHKGRDFRARAVRRVPI
jgi:hypothetical protein